MAEGHQRPHPIADDLQDRQHRDGEKGAGDPPHPIPEDEGHHHQHGVEDEAPRQQHGGESLTFNEVDEKIDPRGQQGMADAVEGHQADQEQQGDAGERTQDGNEIEREGNGPPENRIGQAAEIGGQTGRDADRCVDQSDRAEIGGDLALDLAGDLHRLLLVGKPRQDLDEAAQHHVAGDEEEEQQHRDGAELRQYAAGTGEERARQTRSLHGHHRGFPAGPGGNLLDLMQGVLHPADLLLEEVKPILDPRQALRRLGDPIRRRRREGHGKACDTGQEGEDHQEPGKDAWDVEAHQGAHHRLQREMQDDGEDDRYGHVAGEVKRVDQQQAEDARQQQGLAVARQRHLDRVWLPRPVGDCIVGGGG